MRKMAVKAIIAAAVVALVVGSGIAVAKVVDSGSRDSFCADMPDAAGLYNGNPVTQMGYPVGRVTGVSARGISARVEFDLDPGRRYPSGVLAVTRSKSLLADRSLELVGNYSGGPVLEPGRCIALASSYSPKTLSEIAASANDFIKGLTPTDGTNVAGTVNGLAKALDGTGENLRTVMVQAASAATNPDAVISDIGTVISTMAPLSQSALKDWSNIRSIIEQLPTVLSAGTDLWISSARLTRGVGWLVAVLYDIQRKYGSELWPIMHGPVADAISLAAGRAPDLAKLASSVPAMAGVLAKSHGRPTLNVTPPTVRAAHGEATCALINKGRPGSCEVRGGQATFPADALLSVIISGGRK